MFLKVVILLVGFLFLVKGADWFVEGAASIAKKLGIPQLIIGLTIVAMGTSMAAVSITAALQKNAGITIGNIVGSNILNVLIILGVTAVITNVAIQTSTFRYEIPFMMVVTIILLVFGITGGEVTFVEGIIFWVLFLLYLGYLFVMAKKGTNEEEGETKDYPVWKCILFMVIGGVLVVKGSDFAVFRYERAVYRTYDCSTGYLTSGACDICRSSAERECGNRNRKYRGQQYFQYLVRNRYNCTHLYSAI